MEQSPPLSPQGPAPLSPGKRKAFFETSDESEGDMYIEKWIYLTDNFLSTTAKFPLPLPHKSRVASERYQNMIRPDGALGRAIRDTLARHGISTYGAQFIIQWKPDYPQGPANNDKTLTLSITVEGENTGHWSPAKRALKALVENEIDENFDVCIFNPERAFQPSLFPIVPSDPYITTYESCREQLIRFISSRLNTSWTMVSLYRMGNNLATSQYAVVIMVRPFTFHDWQQLRRDIFEVIIRPYEPPGQHIGVFFLPGSSVIGCQPQVEGEGGHEQVGWDDLPGCSFKGNLHPLPIIGSSIGVVGETGGGSLGGFVSWTHGDNTQQGFITNSHVVEPTHSTNEQSKTYFYEYGVAPFLAADEACRATVQYPSLNDSRKTRCHLAQEIRVRREYVEKLLKDKEERDMLGKKTFPAHEYTLNVAQERLQQDLKEAQIGISFPREIGRTWWASGRAVTEANRIMDVALVEIIDPELQIHSRDNNYIPKYDDSCFEASKPRDYWRSLKTQTKDGILPGERLIGTGDLIKGQWYFKVGRTTGVTTGICHGTEAYVQLEEEGHWTRYDEGGQKVSYEKLTYTQEQVILNAKSDDNPADTQQGDFMKVGDSGSLLIDVKGAVVGLLFGQIRGYVGPSKHYSSNAGLVCTMKDTKDFLRLRLGSDVRLRFPHLDIGDEMADMHL
ncbi:MAG: hypothetical protein Q9217_006968 [Psora testacea]